MPLKESEVEGNRNGPKKPGVCDVLAGNLKRAALKYASTDLSRPLFRCNRDSERAGFACG